ncbi:MAG: hypothetical protein HYT15_04690 [Candidatus Magasanikbacteria bacterium]|nr:hypothetical protein [Candidatus Magasanikbacteria bacterium]
MTRIITHLGYEIESSDPTGGLELPGTWKERFEAMVQFLMDQDYASYVYPGTTPRGLQVFALGESRRSRLLAAHPEDRPGILYLVKDDGEDPDLTEIQVVSAFCIGQVVDNNGSINCYLNIKELLGLRNHRNERLMHKGRRSV